MANQNPSNSSTPISAPQYYAAKAREYAAETRDANGKPGKWPTVVTVVEPNGKSVPVYTSVEWHGFKPISLDSKNWILLGASYKKAPEV